MQSSFDEDAVLEALERPPEIPYDDESDQNWKECWPLDVGKGFGKQWIKTIGFFYQ